MFIYYHTSLFGISTSKYTKDDIISIFYRLIFCIFSLLFKRLVLLISTESFASCCCIIWFGMWSFTFNVLHEVIPCILACLHLFLRNGNHGYYELAVFSFLFIKCLTNYSLFNQIVGIKFWSNCRLFFKTNQSNPRHCCKQQKHLILEALCKILMSLVQVYLFFSLKAGEITLSIVYQSTLYVSKLLFWYKIYKKKNNETYLCLFIL